jgi:hypothetical protein
MPNDARVRNYGNGIIVKTYGRADAAAVNVFGAGGGTAPRKNSPRRNSGALGTNTAPAFTPQPTTPAADTHRQHPARTDIPPPAPQNKIDKGTPPKLKRRGTRPQLDPAQQTIRRQNTGKQKPAADASTDAQKPPPDSGRRVALIIGVTQLAQGSAPVPGEEPADMLRHYHSAMAMRSIVRQFGYGQVTLLTDNQPNMEVLKKETIVSHMRTLVSGVRPGDRLFFGFCGHGFRDRNRRMTPCGIGAGDGHIIWRKELRQILIKQLCPGAHLTVFTTACHSEGLLGLRNVYTDQNRVQRTDAVNDQVPCVVHLAATGTSQRG